MGKKYRKFFRSLFHGSVCPKCEADINLFYALALLRFHKKMPVEDECKSCGVKFGFTKSQINRFWKVLWAIAFFFIGFVLVVIGIIAKNIPILSDAINILFPIFFVFLIFFSLAILIKFLRSYAYFENIFKLNIIESINLDSTKQNRSYQNLN